METKKATISKINVVIDCKDAGIMARFYSQLLNWEWTHPQANGWSAITSPAGMVIAFQEIEEYEPPVWPWQAGKQGQMLHLEEAVRHALSLGARLAGEQYFRTSRTLIDPAGHPFCLDTDEPE